MVGLKNLLVLSFICIVYITGLKGQDVCLSSSLCDCKQDGSFSIKCNTYNKTAARLEISPQRSNFTIDYFQLTQKNYRMLEDFSFGKLNMKDLNLSSNGIEHISNLAFCGLSSLTELTLNNNNLQSIKVVIDSVTASGIFVWALKLDNNKIKRLDVIFTENFKNLTWLFLANNFIDFIDTRILDLVDKLEILNLDNNKIKDFSSITGIIKPNMLNLDVHKNPFKQIAAKNNKQNWTNSVVSLFLESCGLNSIKPFSFVNFGKLRFIHLEKNSLKYLRTNLFAGTVYLKSIDLSFNRIEVIEPNVFVDQESLLTLTLSHNQLTYLSCELFTHLTSLATLTLSYNLITHLGDDTFAHMKSLQNLDLSFNKLSSISSRSLRGLCDLFFLSLTDNPLILISPGAFVDLDVFNPVKLELTHLKLVDLVEGMFQGLDHISSSVFLDNNQLKTIRRNVFSNLSLVAMLSLDHNLISSIEEDAFQGLTEVTEIHLNSNFLTAINPNLFSALPWLELVDLSNNLLRQINSLSFSGMKQLSNIYLCYNQIQKIQPNAFVDLPSIVKIDLRNNKIEEIRKYHFRNLMNLKELDLRENRIISIEPSSFSTVPNLQEFNLASNALLDLKDKTVNSLTEVVGDINLKKNGITYLKVYYFSNLKAARILISFNLISVINNNTFFNLSVLQGIDLQSNNLSTICFYFFSFPEVSYRNRIMLKSLIFNSNRLVSLDFLLNPHLRTVEYLDVSSNQIEYLSLVNFKTLPSLTTLLISYNKIHTFEKGLFSQLGKLQSFYMRNLQFWSNFSVNVAEFSSNLKILDMSGNYLQGMKFKKFAYLETLALQNIQIASFTQIQLELTGEKIRELDLSENRIDFNSSFIRVLSFFSRVNIKIKLKLSYKLGQANPVAG
jgi:Leucine-rich repeat (LRR) protein